MAAAEQTFSVVRNDEDQYSVWPALRPLPLGWSEAGFTGTRPECLTFIEANWHDMRPRSVRSWADGSGAPAASDPA
jgi:MbtH protein